jgi:hypothetical protein
MYEPFTEHKFNSILPKHATKAAQSICKARSRLARIPRLNKELLTRLMEGKTAKRVHVGVKDSEFTYSFD